MRKPILILLSVIIFLSCSLTGFSESVDKESALSLIYEADIPTLHTLLKKGYITCRELTEFYLERINEYNENKNCFTLLFDTALSVADERDKKIASGEDFGLLYGIPFVAKDNIDVAGYVTSNGRPNGFVSTKDAEIIRLLSEEGAVIIGKTNMTSHSQIVRYTDSEIAGETKNAYSSSLSSGGSSGGSAVAVSMGFASFGLGTDMGSSMRYPAALNGLVCLRTTYGLLPSDGISETGTFRDFPAAVTLNPVDQAIVLDAITENKYSFYEKLDKNALSGAKIGVLTELSKYTDGCKISESDVDGEVISAFENVKKEFSDLGAEVSEVSFPSFFTLYENCGDKTKISEEAVNEFYSAFEQLLDENGLDALIFPTMLTSPLHSGYSDGELTAANEPYFNGSVYFISQTGIPEITVQMGNFSSGAGMGFEIVSKRSEDMKILNYAYSYSSKYSHRISPAGASNLHQNKEGLSLSENDGKTEEKQEEPVLPTENGKPFDFGILIKLIPVILLAAAVVFLIIRNKKGGKK